MRTFGGMHPFPRRLGGGEPRLRPIFLALQDGRGDAYSTDYSSVVYAENMALARAISAGWGTNERLGNLWTPERAPEEIVKRWEKILVLTHAPEASLKDRAVAVADLLARDPEAIRTVVQAELAELGDSFYDVEYIPLAYASITVPDGSYPFGVPSTTNPWSSTVARVLIRLVKPTGWTEGEFYDAAALVIQKIDPLLPAWVEVDWYRGSPSGSPIADGPSLAGFYLDDEHNLDNEIFD